MSTEEEILSTSSAQCTEAESENPIDISLGQNGTDVTCLKRRWHSPPQQPESEEIESNGSDDTSSVLKRARLEDSGSSWKPTYWLAFDLVTAGHQGSELGRDQTPIVFITAILGMFEKQSRIIDRFAVKLKPVSILCNTLNSPESSSQLRGKINPLTETQHESELFNPSGDVDQVSKPVTISLDAMKAADWNEPSHLPCMQSSSLSEAMNQLLEWLQSHGIPTGQDYPTTSMVLITDGHLPIRNVLHPQAAYIGIERDVLQKSPWNLYLNVVDWCRESSKLTPGESGVVEPYPAIENFEESYNVFGRNNSKLPDECNQLKVDKIAEVVMRLIELDIPLCEPQIIRTIYEHHVFSRELVVGDNCTVEVRQVPWSATPSVIAGFFTGLNIIPGGVAIRLTEGRRSNTSIVAFESVLCAQLALSRHQHQLCGALFPVAQSEPPGPTDGHDQLEKSNMAPKPVMLQIYNATSREFVHCAGCDQPMVTEFLNQLTDGKQVVVRVRGLPYTTTKEQILEFFQAINAVVLYSQQGIYFVAYPEGRPTGDAFVLFADDQTATRALLRHRDYLGDRYVELFKASPSEMVQVCFNVSQSSNSQSSNLKGHRQSPASLSFDPQSCSRSLSINGLSSSLPMGSHGTSKASTLTPLPHSLFSNAYQPVPIPMSLPPSLFSSIPTVSNPTLALWNALGTDVNPFLHAQKTPLNLFQCNPSASIAAVNTLGAIPFPVASQSTSPCTRDFTDPTDPECPYARPIPLNGVSAMIRLSELPVAATRHDMRLYLGPGNMAKVFRMRRMDPTPNQLTSTWLLSVTDTTEGVQLIRDLIKRQFTLNNAQLANPMNTNLGGNQANSVINSPTFSLFHVGSDKTLVPVSLGNPALGLPAHRIHNVIFDPVISLQSPITPSPGFVQTPTSTLVNETWNGVGSLRPTMTTVANTVDSASLWAAPHSQIGSRTVPTMVPSLLARDLIRPQLIHGLSSPYDTSIFQQQLQQRQTDPRTNTGYALANMTASTGEVNSPHQTTYSGASWPQNSNHSSMVLLTGVPLDVTTNELQSLFQAMNHLLSVPPQFSFFQPQLNGTLNVVATFQNCLEAQVAAATCCSSINGTLRFPQYPIQAILLGPQTSVPGIEASDNAVMDMQNRGAQYSFINLLQNPLSNNSNSLH